MSSAVGGDTAVLAIGTSPPTFNAIAELRNVIAWPEHTRNVKDVTPRGATIDSYLTSPLMRRGVVSFAGNYLQANSTHDDSATGLHGLYIANTKFALQFQGPNFSSGVTDDLIMSGTIISFLVRAGSNADEYDFAASFRPTGVEMFNGTTVGSAT